MRIIARQFSRRQFLSAAGASAAVAAFSQLPATMAAESKASPDRKMILSFYCDDTSHFAELLFNDLATAAGLDWFADSRGLNITGGRNVGPMFQAAIDGLCCRNIPLPAEIRFPMPLCEADLCSSALVIALKEAEHRPTLEKGFPRWAHQVEYWHVHDLDQATAEEALSEIERHVRQLIARMRQSDGAAT